MNANSARSFPSAVNVSQESPFSAEDYRSDLVNVDRRYRAALVSGFVFVNFTLFLALGSLEFFALVREDLFTFVGSLFGIAAIACTLAYGYEPAKRAVQLAIKGSLSVELLFTLNATLALGMTLWWAYSDFAQFGASLLAEYLIVTSFLLFLLLYLRAVLWQSLADSFALSLQREVPQVLRICSEGEDASLAVSQAGELVPINQIRAGDVIRVKAGGLVPVDALVIDGLGIVYEREFTLRGTTVQRQAGSALFAGSVLKQGELVCRVQCRSEESRITTFINPLLFSPTSIIADNTERLFVGALLFFGIFLSLYWSDQGLLLDYIEPVFGSALALTMFCEYFAVRKLLGRIVENIGLNAGFIENKPHTLIDLHSVDSLSLYAEQPEQFRAPLVESIELLDDRIERDMMLNVLFSVFSNLEHPLSNEIIRSVEKEMGSRMEAIALDDLEFFSAEGLIAFVQGAEFSIGSEEFLLERGIYLHSNALAGEADTCLFVALQTAVVAMVKVHSTMHNVAEVCSTAGIDVNLYAPTQQEALDVIGKEMGLELPKIHGEMSQREFALSLPQGKSIAYAIDPKLLQDVSDTVIKVTPLDRLIMEDHESHISLLDGSLIDFIRALASIKRVYFWERAITIATFAISALALIPIAAGVLSSEIILLMVALGFFGLIVLSRMLLKGYK